MTIADLVIFEIEHAAKPLFFGVAASVTLASGPSDFRGRHASRHARLAALARLIFPCDGTADAGASAVLFNFKHAGFDVAINLR